MDNEEFSSQEGEVILGEQRKYFATQVTKDIDFRIKQLNRLKSGIQKYEEELSTALYRDLGKHKNEAYMTEIGLVYHSIALMSKN